MQSGPNRSCSNSHKAPRRRDITAGFSEGSIRHLTKLAEGPPHELSNLPSTVNLWMRALP